MQLEAHDEPTWSWFPARRSLGRRRVLVWPPCEHLHWRELSRPPHDRRELGWLQWSELDLGCRLDLVGHQRRLNDSDRIVGNELRHHEFGCHHHFGELWGKHFDGLDRELGHRSQ